MNRNVFAIAVLAFGALLPAPTTQGAQLDDCLDYDVDVDRVVQNVRDALASDAEVPEIQLDARDCTGELTCEGVVSSINTREDPSAVCSLRCEEIFADGGSANDLCSGSLPGVEHCQGGQAGVVVDGVEYCVDTHLGQVELCDDGRVGVVVQEKEACFARSDDPIGIDDCPLDWLCHTPAVGGGTDPNCSKGEDDGGFGGTDVNCKYACPKLSELGIGVVAMDSDAGTYGDTACGGADAWCNKDLPQCADVSGELTSRAEQNQKCNGHSDEFNNSPTTVYCVAVGPGTAQKALCDLDERLCVAARIHTANPEANLLCMNQVEAEVSTIQETVRELASAIPSGAVSFVAFQFTATNGVAIRYEHLGGSGPWCTFETFVL